MTSIALQVSADACTAFSHEVINSFLDAHSILQLIPPLPAAKPTIEIQFDILFRGFTCGKNLDTPAGRAS
jgi:hypothetical protein